MVINYSAGKIIVTPMEIVIRVSVSGGITMQAYRDTITLYGDACVIAANSGDAKWSLTLDNQEQLCLISKETGVEIL
ncbi:DUF3389 family protein [Vibrio salinus]|uniref:DUF3389 family protein n=1 Tax=Vibrio salinus TaxID=2899784 RepID=UPI001E5D2CDD|nr:DUF3389 family protein [Vibrio salinus]MCE0495734.1 DUF3389 domain-containing protein [Vibrio salinus]